MLVVLLLRGRVWGSIRVHLLWVHLCFSSKNKTVHYMCGDIAFITVIKHHPIKSGYMLWDVLFGWFDVRGYSILTDQTPSNKVRLYFEILLGRPWLEVMILRPRNHTWTQGNHMMKTFLEAKLLFMRQFLCIFFNIYIHIILWLIRYMVINTFWKGTNLYFHPSYG